MAETRKRQSITLVPHARALLKKMSELLGISKNDLLIGGIELLHFFWTILRRGGEIGVKLPGDEKFKTVHIFIPGLTRPSPPNTSDNSQASPGT